jgi:hypothetical protein
LLLRVASIQLQNGGLIRSHVDSLAGEPHEVDTVYESALPGRPFTAEEIDLMEQMAAEIDRRLPPDMTEGEREARTVELMREDKDVAALLDRLKQLAAENGGSPIHYMYIDETPQGND